MEKLKVDCLAFVSGRDFKFDKQNLWSRKCYKCFIFKMSHRCFSLLSALSSNFYFHVFTFLFTYIYNILLLYANVAKFFVSALQLEL